MAKENKEKGEKGAAFWGLRILVVEDDLFFQEYVKDSLVKEGAEVVGAQDGEAGLALANSSRPHLILLDVEIPKLNGFEVLRTLRSQPETASLPVVIMSGKVEKAVLDRHAQTRLKADGYLVKPFSPQELSSALRAALDQAGVPAGTPSAAPEGGAAEGPRILVVDDSTHIRGMVGDSLREAGATVLEAADGKAGLARAMETLPDAILLDVQMPHLNGFVVCELLKKDPKTRSIPIIIMSAVADEETFRKHSRLKNRADAYLLKPFKKADLFALLGRLTGHANFLPQRPQEKTGFLLPPPSEGAPAKSPPAAPGRTPAQEELHAAREKELRDEAGRVSAERDRLREELEAQVAAAEERKRELTDKLGLALKRIEELTSAEGKEKDEEKRLRKELASAQVALTDAEAAKKAVEAKARELEADAAAADEARVMVEQELTSVRMELEEAEESRNEQVKALDAEVSGLREKSASLAGQVASLEEQVGALKGQVKAAESQGATRAADLSQESEKALALVRQELAAAKKMAASETAARMDAESRLVALTQEREQAAKASAGDREKLKSAEARVQDLLKSEGEKAKLASELAAARESLARAEEAIREKESSATDRSASDQKARAALEKEKALLKEELSVAVKRAAECDALSIRVAEKERFLKEAEARAKDEAARAAGIEASLEKARAEIDRLDKERSHSDRERGAAHDKLAAEKAALEKESASLRDRLSAAEKANAEGASRLGALGEELAALRKQSDQVKAGLGETEKKALAREEELHKEQAARKKAEEELAAARKQEEESALRQAALERSAQAEKARAAAAQQEAGSLRERLAQEEKKGLDLSGAVANEERKGRELLLDAEKSKAVRTQLENSLAETRKKLEETARARDALQKTLGETKAKVDEAAKSREAQDKAFAAQKKSSDEIERARAALEKSLADEKSRHAATAEQVKKAQAEGEALRKTLAASGEKGGKLEGVLKELEAKVRSLSSDLEKERNGRVGAENALREARKEADRSTGDREKRESALKSETAKVAKEKDEAARKAADALGEGRKLADRIKALEAEVAQAAARERDSASSLARVRGIMEAGLQQAQGTVAAPGGHREGLEALVRSLQASLEKEIPGAKLKGAPRPARAGGGGKGALAAGIAAGLVAGVVSGYLVLPQFLGGRPAPSASSTAAPAGETAPAASVDDSPELIEYAKSWSRLTAEASSEDLRIQATLHSLAEGEAAFRLMGRKNGWSGARLEEKLKEVREVLGDADFLFATVMVRGGTTPAPSEKDLLKRLQVKDPWGKMTPAIELSRGREVGKVLLQAARAPNPDYQEGTGVTVAFSRKGLRLEANTLQLVLQPTGSEPGRMVSWDLSGWGG